MISEWFQRVGSSVPRGFSRYFILELLKEKNHTGKEIIDYAVEQSNGIWKPSPGLIYPLLGRLLDEGLIEEAKDGKYQLTKKGIETASDVDKINDIVNDIPINAEIKMEPKEIQYNRVLVAPYWRYHAKMTGFISVGSHKETIDNTEIMEFLSFS